MKNNAKSEKWRKNSEARFKKEMAVRAIKKAKAKQAKRAATLTVEARTISKSRTCHANHPYK
jgi:hypothetical protein